MREGEGGGRGGDGVADDGLRTCVTIGLGVGVGLLLGLGK